MKGSGKPNNWIQFVQQVRKANPQLSYKEALQLSSKLYKQ